MLKARMVISCKLPIGVATINRLPINMLESLTGLIIQLIKTSGYPGIFFLMVLNASAIPFPSEITLPFSGFLASQGNLMLNMVIFTGVLGDLVGSIIGYFIGFLLEDNVIINFIKKYGKFILLTEEEYEKAIKWIKRYGAPFVFVGKITPGIKSFISVAAGITHVKFSKFIVANILGGLIYVSIVTYVGYYLGSRWNILGGYIRKFELLIIVILIIGVVWYINRKLKFIKFKKN